MSKLIYDPETGHFFNGTRRVGSFAGDKDGYLRIYFRGGVHRAHRVAWFLTYGYWPKEIDHINGKPSDNRLANLRECANHQDNMQNRNIQSNNISGVLGIWPDRGRWRAAITVNGVRTRLGSFRTKEEAAAARRNAELRLRQGALESPVRAPLSNASSGQPRHARSMRIVLRNDAGGNP